MKQIQKRLEQTHEQIRLYELIIPVLEAEKEKSITKRLATKLQKAIEPEDKITHVLYYPDKYGSKEVHIYNHSILGYDEGITLRYGDWGDCYVAKSEQDTIDKELDSCIKRLENLKNYVPVLEYELKNFKAMAKDYVSIANDYKKACKAFVKKWGKNEGYCGHNISYVTKRELETFTSEKVSI